MRKSITTAVLAAVASVLLTTGAKAWTTECKDQRCGISINVNDEAKKQRLLTLAILVNKDGTDPSLFMTAPLGLALEPGARLVIGTREIALKFKVCYPDGCQAVASLTAADLADLRAAASVDTRFFVQGNEKPLSATIDFTGLGAAIDAAMKQ